MAWHALRLLWLHRRGALPQGGTVWNQPLHLLLWHALRRGRHAELLVLLQLLRRHRRLLLRPGPSRIRLPRPLPLRRHKQLLLNVLGRQGLGRPGKVGARLLHELKLRRRDPHRHLRLPLLPKLRAGPGATQLQSQLVRRAACRRHMAREVLSVSVLQLRLLHGVSRLLRGRLGLLRVRNLLRTALLLHRCLRRR